MKRQIEIRVRLNVDFDSSEAALADYLHDIKAAPYPLREMVMLALKSYWLPFAYKHQKVNYERLQQATLDSIYRLQLHLKYLQSTMGIMLDSGVVTSGVPVAPDAYDGKVSDSLMKVVEDADDSAIKEYVGEDADDGEWNVPFGFTSKLGEIDDPAEGG